jgi:hypothetical protein
VGKKNSNLAKTPPRARAFTSLPRFPSLSLSLSPPPPLSLSLCVSGAWSLSPSLSLYLSPRLSPLSGPWV